MYDKFLSADIFRVNSSGLPPVRGGLRADPPVSARSPPVSAERSPDVRRSPPENNFGGSSPDPRGTGRSPRVSARIRAEPRRKVLRRANCQLLL